MFQHLDKLLDQEHGLDAGPLIDSWRQTFVSAYDPIRPDREVALRVAGLAHCEGAERDLVLFAQKSCKAAVYAAGGEKLRGRHSHQVS